LIGILADLLPKSTLDSSQVKTISERYFYQGQQRAVHRGKSEAASYYKSLFLFARNISLSLPLPQPIPFTKTNKKGIPKDLIPLIPLLRGSSDDKKIGLTIARFYESFYSKPVPNYEAIEASYTGNIESFDEFRRYLDDNLIKVTGNLASPDKFKIVNRLTKGPNGNSMLTSHFDAVAVTEDKDLLKAHKDLAEIYPK
jgi:hypothetical protein